MAVPITTPESVLRWVRVGISLSTNSCDRCPVSLARPKSITFAMPSLRRMMFLRLHVAMHDSVRMGGERTCDLDSYVQDFSEHYRLHSHSFTQRRAFDKFCSDERSGIALVDFV